MFKIPATFFLWINQCWNTQCVFQLAAIKKPEGHVIWIWIEFQNTTCNCLSLLSSSSTSLVLRHPPSPLIVVPWTTGGSNSVALGMWEHSQCPIQSESFINICIDVRVIENIYVIDLFCTRKIRGFPEHTGLDVLQREKPFLKDPSL